MGKQASEGPVPARLTPIFRDRDDLPENRSRIIDFVRSFEEQKERTYGGDIAMIKLMSAVITALAAVTGLGIVGVAGALTLNWFLDTEYSTGRVPLWYLPLGMVALWLLGQVAVLLPARRAANIPPALATRSV